MRDCVSRCAVGAATAFLLFAAGPLRAEETTQPPAGLRENLPGTHAFVGATIVVSPGKTLEQGTVVVRDGVILAVGKDAAVPADARVWDVSGKTIYPGFVDGYSELEKSRSANGSEEPPASGGAKYWNPNVRPEFDVADIYQPDKKLAKQLRSQGITVQLVAPAEGILCGQSALVATSDCEGRKCLLQERVALHGKLMPKRGSGRRVYPNSPMGAMALFRQAMLDAQWYAQAWSHYQKQQGVPRPERNDALAALQDYVAGKRPVMIDTYSELYFLRADRVGREFDLDVIVHGSGHEYKRLAAIKQSGRAVILPLNFPKPPRVRTPEEARDVSLSRLMHWDLAPENPARLAAEKIRIAFCTAGLKKPADFLGKLRQAVERGLSREDALAALTTTPCELFGVEKELGTLAAGKLGHLVITDGDLFDKKSKVVEVWIDGQRYETSPQPLADLRGKYDLQIQDGDHEHTFTLELAGQPDKLSGKLVAPETDAEEKPEEIKLSHAVLDHSRLGFTFPSKTLGHDGVARASAVLVGEKIAGQGKWADGEAFAWTATRRDGKAAEGEEEKDKKPDGPKQALFEVNYPLGAYGVEALPEQPAVVLFQGGTVWTSGPQGVLQDADVLVKNGKVAAVGQNLRAPKGAVTVQLDGRHVTPGLIDCHSHIATDGGINESTQTITAEVRIGDYIDCDDINIYRQLAGGVTSSNILHGSANTIGGQNQVLKFRWGALPEAMKFAQAPPGVKFALGENVKQSNWGDKYRSRYPQTRMGVEQLTRDAFDAARDYRRKWKAWTAGDRSGLPPRVDLELEALAEILEGKRWIHCHSYRQDEILALMRTCEDYDVTIGSLQHILEGYKVADAMAKHGATGSAFSDWWAYKFEVYDAIPYNGALMHKAGVVVSFNSDDAELARRLNTEAAKAIKYGNLTPAEALKFVTLNPAKQLRIDRWVGSLEKGKDADLVVWSGDPLSTLTYCEQTWVDGRKYFDRADDARRREEVQKMRTALIARVLDSGEEPATPEEEAEGKVLWPRHDIYCHHHGHGHEHGH